MFYSPDDIAGLSSLSRPSHISGGEIFDHGLGRDPLRTGSFAVLNPRISISPNSQHVAFGITHHYPVDLAANPAENAVHHAVSMLEQHVLSWQDYVTYQRLGYIISMVPGDAVTDNAEDSTSSSNPNEANRVHKKFALSPHHYGYIALHHYLARNIHQYAEHFSADALAMAHQALNELLPPQAYLFIPPHDLMIASKEAERIAADTLKLAHNGGQKTDGKPTDLYGQVKRKLSHGIRALRIRHDGRMHIFPYTQLSAPETGVATIAIIASQQQSIVGDHGRYSGVARGLVI